ncbi:MAG: FoF1 ATP synthase subunit gamma [Candidatus Omnitrophota bacterium]
MIPLIKLREDLRFAKELLEMIDVLKSATSSQFRGLQQKRKGFEDFKFKLEEFQSDFGVGQGTRHPFLTENKKLPKAVVMITSDEGFLGSLNALVLAAGLEQAAGEDELIVMGERGSRYLAESQSRAFTYLAGIGDDISYNRAAAVRDMLITHFLEGRIGSVLVAYPRFMSLTVQRIEVTRILPCGDIFGRKEGEDGKAVIRRRSARPALAEPSPESVVDYMVRAFLMQKFHDIFLDSKLSECAARIIHLEGSHEEIKNLNRKLMYDYFKHLHEKSDKNIREIFASRLRWREEEKEELALRLKGVQKHGA